MPTFLLVQHRDLKNCISLIFTDVIFHMDISCVIVTACHEDVVLWTGLQYLLAF